MKNFINDLHYRAGDIWHLIQDRHLFWQIKRNGGSYADFYEAKMDRKALKVGESVNGLPKDKEYHLEFLRQNGLKPSMCLLDYGCGAAASGITIIQYLDEGFYVGADVSRECLKLASERVEHSGLEDKVPTFLHLPGGSLEPIRNRNFDIIWAQSVLTHLPETLVENFFDLAKETLKPKGRVFATFTNIENSGTQSRVKNFAYSAPHLQALASSRGLKAQVIKSWVHPLSTDDRMLEIKC